MKPEDHRTADHPIDPLFIRRWSPRAMTGDSITDAQMLALFEAARWAPSTYNEQEWQFIYARRDTPQWAGLFNLLVESNQAWCKDAAMLFVVVAHKVFGRNGKPNPVHLFDAGAACENLALQATLMGLAAHGMSGFDYDGAKATLNVPDDYAVAAMFAVGHPGEGSDAEIPSVRRPVAESIREGTFA